MMKVFTNNKEALFFIFSIFGWNAFNERQYKIKQLQYFFIVFTQHSWSSYELHSTFEQNSKNVKPHLMPVMENNKIYKIENL